MRAIDSNVLVRYVTRDEASQFERARRLLEEELDASRPGLVLDVVLVETCWVLRRLYGASRTELQKIIAALLRAPHIVFEDRAAVSRALKLWAEQGGDFADALVVERAKARGAAEVLTFDRRAIKLGMTLLEGRGNPPAERAAAT